MRNTEKGYLPVLSLFLAASLVLSYIEALVPLPFGVPGMKLGLANLMTVLLLYRYSWREALAVNLLRILLTGFLFGGLSGILFSLSGALVSFVCMLLLKKTGRFGIPGVSCAGGVMHNAGQLAVAAFLVRTYGVLFLVPVLVAAGALCGFAVGLAAAAVLPVLKRIG